MHEEDESSILHQRPSPSESRLGRIRLRAFKRRIARALCDGQHIVAGRIISKRIDENELVHAFLHSDFYPHSTRPINLPWFVYLSRNALDAGLRIPFPQAEQMSSYAYLIRSKVERDGEGALPSKAMFTFSEDALVTVFDEFELAKLEPPRPSPPVQREAASAADLYQDAQSIGFYSVQSQTNALGLSWPSRWRLVLYSTDGAKVDRIVSGTTTRITPLTSFNDYFSARSYPVRVQDFRFRDREAGIGFITYTVKPDTDLVVDTSTDRLQAVFKRKLSSPKHSPLRRIGALALVAVAALVFFLVIWGLLDTEAGIAGRD